MDQGRKERIKRKREERGEHVSPAAGREARRTRRQAWQDAGRGWLGWFRWRRPINSRTLDDEIVPMQARSDTLAARRAERRTRRQIEQSRPVERVRPSGVIWISWRWVSGTMTAILLLVLYVLLTSDAFYVSSIGVGGTHYLSREDVFRFAGVSEMHIFWVDPAAVEARLESSNNIAAAEVRVGWGDQLVQVVVEERDPVLIWESGGRAVWVDINGIVMYLREDRPDLLRIIHEQPSPDASDLPAEIDPLGSYSRIERQIVHGALLLRSRLTHIDVLLYDPQKGLGWRDPRGWMVWFGVGDNMAMKALVYEAIIETCGDEVQFGEVDVADPDYPSFKILWQKETPQTRDCVVGS